MRRSKASYAPLNIGGAGSKMSPMCGSKVTPYEPRSDQQILAMNNQSQQNETKLRRAEVVLVPVLI
eukprot:SAG31_NODE_13887_length_839_cov_1.544595_1_plen_65_part_10